MPASTAAFPWPINARPAVRVVVQAPLVASGFSYAYRTGTHALHLHDYDGAIRLAGEEHRLTPGTLTWSPAGLDSSYDLPRPGTHWCIHFEPSTDDGPTIDVPLIQSVGPHQPEGVARFTHMIRLRSLLATTKDAPTAEAVQVAISVACQDLILWAAMLGRSTSAAGPVRSAIIDKVTDYIDRNLHRPLPVGDLVAHAGLTQNYLARLLRRHTGQTMPAYVLGRRMALANLLLTTSDLPIKQVALRIGIRDAQQFNKLFRRHMGLSPTERRRTMVQRN